MKITAVHIACGGENLDEYHINGGKSVYGSVRASGAKNAALPILAAAILTGDESRIENCPNIEDVKKMKSILRETGCRVTEDKDGIIIDSSALTSCSVERSLMESMRSSMFMTGALLARLGRAEICKPGGCQIGARPIDIHLSILSKLGADIMCSEEKIVLNAKKLCGTELKLPLPSVGATENAMTAAVCADGCTVIKGAAKEPEIEALQDYLNACGGRITGAGTDEIRIDGVASLHGARHKIISDRIEGGTFLTLAAMTGGHIFLENGIALHMEALIEALREAGCIIKISSGGIEINAPERLRALGHIITYPYPGFPTDMQSQMLAAMSIADGETIVTETIFENRFSAAKELNKMGGEIEIKKKNAIIKGICSLKGADVTARDLRGGAALCIAAAAADGMSIVRGLEHIDRGYCEFDGKLRRLGVDIRRIRHSYGNRKRS